MSKINLNRFDKLIAEQVALVKASEKHSLDSIIKEEQLALLQRVEDMISRSSNKEDVDHVEKEKVESEDPKVELVTFDEKAEVDEVEVTKVESKKKKD